MPLIMSGPGINSAGQLTNEFVFVTDLAPTILSLAEVPDHQGSFNGKGVEEIIGNDFCRFLSGDDDQYIQKMSQ